MPSARPAALVSLALLVPLGAAAWAGPAPWEKQERSTTTLHGVVRRVVVDVDAGTVSLGHGLSSRVDATSTWFMTKPTLTVSLRSGVLTVRGRCPSFVSGPAVHLGDPTGSCRTDVAVTLAQLPRGVDLGTGVGDVSVTGARGPVALRTGYGEVRARDLRGPVRVSSDGDADLMDVVATGVQVSTATGEAGLTRVRSSRPVVVRTTSGAVSAVALRAPRVQVTSDSGTLQLVDVRADALSATTAGSVFLNDSTVGRADLGSSAGTASVTAVTARSRLSVRTDQGQASLVQVRTPRLDVASGAGDVAVTVPAGPYVLALRTDSGAITLDGVRSDPGSASSITVSSGTGDIALHGR
ncbi:MAG TPA: DUF4097 family beta strand repeat-containing protein [Mycobacteriales bacterium]|nr:DUF4097 family beta strand repeat-containing protein [Mycobacteriales bacterium]